MLLILVTLALRSDSDFERSNASLKEDKPDGDNPNSNDIEYYVQKNEGKIRWFSADCTGKIIVVGESRVKSNRSELKGSALLLII